MLLLPLLPPDVFDMSASSPASHRGSLGLLGTLGACFFRRTSSSQVASMLLRWNIVDTVLLMLTFSLQRSRYDESMDMSCISPVFIYFPVCLLRKMVMPYSNWRHSQLLRK